jgi:hypothetical protein
MLNPYVILGVVLTFGVATGGAYIKGRIDGKDLAEGAALREERIAQQSRDAAHAVTADAISKIKITNKTIHARVEREIYEKPVYRECRHDAGGVLGVNEALAGQTEPAADRKLPPANAPH